LLFWINFYSQIAIYFLSKLLLLHPSYILWQIHCLRSVIGLCY
jgi:hypothetical protein